MPYEWDIEIGSPPAPSGAASFAVGDPPLAQLHLWPYRSLPRRGFVGIIGLAFILTLIPMFPLIGSVFLWILLPFGLAALAALWFFLDKSYRDGELIEELSLWSDLVRLDRHGQSGAHQTWEANPYWVALTLYKTGGPVPNYLTLKGDGREVEIGAFLSEDERPKLHDDLAHVLTVLKSRS